MKREDLIKFCNDWLPAWTGNQPEKLIKFYDENAYYQDPAYPGGLNGREQILPYFKKLLARNPDWRWELVEIFPTDKGCTAKWKATIPVGEKVIIEYGMDIVELNNNKVTRNEVYFDRSRLLELILEQIKNKK